MNRSLRSATNDLGKATLDHAAIGEVPTGFMGSLTSLPSADTNLLARTQPAEPAPTMMKSYCADALGDSETGCAGGSLFMYDDRMVNSTCSADTEGHVAIENVCLSLLPADFIAFKRVINCNKLCHFCNVGSVTDDAYKCLRRGSARGTVRGANTVLSLTLSLSLSLSLLLIASVLFLSIIYCTTLFS
jgi:hypothetical protein